VQYPIAADSTISSGKRKIDDIEIKQEKTKKIKQEPESNFFKYI